MAGYRLMDGQSGRPGNGPSAAISYSGAYTAGLLFKVTQGGMWLTGFWWWVCNSGQAATATKCALWSVGVPSGGGTLVPGSVVTSGTLTAGQWNYIPLAAPIQLAIGSTYCAAIGVGGSFPNTPNQFGSGQTYAAGIASGPLSAFSDQSGTLPEPYGHAQGTFSTGGSDPSVTIPLSGNASDNNWVDVQVSDTVPAGYSGSYRLWPNKWDGSATAALDQAQPFTLATEIRTSVAATANNVWFFSPPGAASLPTWAGVYRISDQSLIAAAASPSWTAPSGGAASAGGGWCKCALPPGTTLAAGQYKAAVYNAGGASGSWSPREYGYFATGTGAAGIVNGPLSSPSNSAASSAYVYFNNPTATPPYTSGAAQEPANGTFAQSGPQFPYLAVDYAYPGTSDPAGAVAESFYVDLEVTPAVSGSSGLLMAGGII